MIKNSDTDGVNKIEDTNILLARDKTGSSPIMRAAESGDLGMVNVLMTRVPQSVKTTDTAGRTVLHYAARCRDDDIREQLTTLLISKGADKNAKDLVNLYNICLCS